MPESRKRPGHHDYKKPADIPAKQRVRGRISMAILFGVFALLIALFNAQGSYVIWIAAACIGALIGYIIGKNMEKSASKKTTS
jgi:predicted membrane-bound spermidine synthase